MVAVAEVTQFPAAKRRNRGFNTASVAYSVDARSAISAVGKERMPDSCDSGRFAFDTGPRKLFYRLRRRRRRQFADVRRHVVADCFRASFCVFRFRLATICGKSQRPARQPRLLLIQVKEGQYRSTTAAERGEATMKSDTLKALLAMGREQIDTTRALRRE